MNIPISLFISIYSCFLINLETSIAQNPKDDLLHLQIDSLLYAGYGKHGQQFIYNQEHKHLLTLDVQQQLQAVANKLYRVKENRFESPKTFLVKEEDRTYYWYTNQKLHLIIAAKVKIINLGKYQYIMARNAADEITVYTEDFSILKRYNKGKKSHLTLTDYGFYWIQDDSSRTASVFNMQNDSLLFTVEGVRSSFEYLGNRQWIYRNPNKKKGYKIVNDKGITIKILPYTFAETLTKNKVNLFYDPTISIHRSQHPQTEYLHLLRVQRQRYGKDGIYNVRTDTEILPCEDYRIFYGGGQYLTLTNTDNNKILAKIEEDSIRNLQEKGVRNVHCLDSQNALIQTEKYYYLYNLLTEKRSKVEFDSYEYMGDNIAYFKRFGFWFLYDLQKQSFKTDLSMNGDLPLYLKGWLVENYSPFIANSSTPELIPTEDPKEKRQLQTHLFTDSKLIEHKKEVTTNPIIFYHPNNLKLRIEVPSKHRAQTHQEYLLYENENGFHLVDSTGKYLIQNKNWDNACILRFADPNTLICLYLKGGKRGLFDVHKSQSIKIPANMQDYRTNHQLYSNPSFFVPKNEKRQEGAWVYNNSQNRLVTFPMFYAHIYEHNIDLEGNSWILVEKEDNYYWVNETGKEIFLDKK